jgi:GYF domain 2
VRAQQNSYRWQRRAVPIGLNLYCRGARGIFLDWYIARAGVSYGPFTAEEFARFQAEGQLTATDQVWRKGLDQWILYQDFRSPPDGLASNEVDIDRRDGSSPRKCSVCLIARRLARAPYDTLRTILELVRHPTEFAQQRIDVGPRDLHRAVFLS